MARKRPRRKNNPGPRPETPDLIMTLPPEIRNRTYELSLIFQDQVVQYYHIATLHQFLCDTMATNLLMSLKPEDRYRIYKFSLTFEDREMNLNSPSKMYRATLRRMTALLQVSKEIRDEALPLFLGENAIMYHLDPFNQETCVKAATWLRHVARRFGRQPFQKTFRFGIHQRSIWTDLHAICPLLEAIHETGIVVSPGEERRAYVAALESGPVDGHLETMDGSLFRLVVGVGIYPQRYLDLGVVMAEKAARDGWTKEQVEREYAQILELAKKSSAAKVAARQAAAREKKRSG